MNCCPDSSDSEDEQKSKYRECTDVFWLCIFFLFWILMIFIAAFAYVYGNPLQLINGADTFGNVCGSKFNEKFTDFNLSGVEMAEKRYLFYMDFQNHSHSLRICVEECPDKNVEDVGDLKDFYRRTGSSLCRYDVNVEHLGEKNMSLFSPIGPCPLLPVFKSTPIVNRCVPETHIINHLATYGWDVIEEILRDLYKNWHWILAFTVLSFSLSVILISLMYVFASAISYVIMVSIGIVSVVGTTVLWWTYFEIKCKLDAAGEELLDEDINNEEAFIWYSVTATIFTLVVLLVMFSIRKHVSFLVALFQESSNCLSELPILYFQPVLSFALLLAFYIFWISVVVCLATASYPAFKDKHLFGVDNLSLSFPSDGGNLSHTINYTAQELQSYSASEDEHRLGAVNSSLPASFNVGNSSHEIKINYTVQELQSYTEVEYVNIPWLKHMFFVYVIGLIWISEFILACQHMIVAGSVAKWYFSRNTKNASSMVCVSMGSLICYHIGSLALGSLLITLLKVPRIILTYLHKKLRKNEDSNCAACALTCCSCCFYCLEKFVRYMNHNAYTMVAIQGVSLCPAAYRAWKILVMNTLKLATVNSVGDFILFLSKCLVTIMTMAIAVMVLRYDPNLHLFAASILIICIFAYFVAHSVISLYEIVIDTLFLCICQDYQINGIEGQWKATTLASISYRNFKSCSMTSPPIELQRTN